MPYYTINITHKTVKPSHLKILQIIQNIKNLVFQIIFIFSDWILIKQIIVSSHFSTVGRNRFLKECCLVEWVISFWLGRDDEKLKAIFEWLRAWVKMHQINAFSRIVNLINLVIEIQKGCILESNLEGQGW